MHLRTSWTAWTLAAFLPLPVLLTVSPTNNAQVSCLYLGLASAWLATELFRSSGLPESFAAWRAKSLAVGIAVFTNAALFILLGTAVGVRSNISFPLVAVLSAIPAVGLVPWLTMRVREPYTALIVAATIVFGLKLVACIVTRIAYGSDYVGAHVAGDWRTAKLMISMFWILTAGLSLSLLLADCRRFKDSPSEIEPVQS